MTETQAPAIKKSASLMQLRWRRFRRIKRGYYSFWILTGAYLLSFLLPLLMNGRALVVRYQGQYFFPAFACYLYDNFGYSESLGIFREKAYPPTTFGVKSVATRTDYRDLKNRFAESAGGDFVIMPPFPYGPGDHLLDLPGNPPHAPSREHWLGTDDRARDVLARLTYGFRISITFALIVTLVSYTVGTLIGAVLGYFGRWIDLIGLRFVEIWAAIPFLYTVMILSAMLGQFFFLLVGILAAFGWIGISFYIRGEFYREKAKDYVAAAIATGEGNFRIITRHILPNALTPIIAFAPFSIVGNIGALVALDYLGFGLPVGTPSWGEMIHQGRENIRDWHLVVFPLLAMFLTLQLIVFIGEALREAFDPKVFSRLR